MSSTHTLRALTSTGGLPMWMLLLHLYIRYVVAEDIRVVGRVGNSIFLHPKMHLHTKISDVRWKHVDTDMLIAKNGTLVNLTDRCEIFLNGSLKFNEGLKRDSGNYTVQQYSDNGDFLSEQHIELSILEPVSKPKVRTSCTFDGRVVLTCSVDKGDRVVMNWTEQPYAWTGSNQTLSSGPVLFLGSYTPGNLTCVAMNEISEEGFSPVVPTCRGRTSAVAAFGLFAFAMTTLAVAILNLKMRCQKKKKGKSQTEYVEENNYIEMRGNLCNKCPQEETTIHLDQDTSHYEFCRPIAPASSQRKRRLSLELNDIYV
ncbi:T-cell surface antigen CD2-like isoform X1 [Salmo salar]|uniref:T-cell surface antigen CD2-like isoform X1 n=2 Tax=Salmo salar TaxID=8030 RepID=A0ABM3CHR1_SALSA|nr:T-cell surface antigen CD2-like isoform X1 [Salmo salar]